MFELCSAILDTRDKKVAKRLNRRDETLLSIYRRLIGRPHIAFARQVQIYRNISDLRGFPTKLLSKGGLPIRRGFPTKKVQTFRIIPISSREGLDPVCRATILYSRPNCTLVSTLPKRWFFVFEMICLGFNDGHFFHAMRWRCFIFYNDTISIIF